MIMTGHKPNEPNEGVENLGDSARMKREMRRAADTEDISHEDLMSMYLAIANSVDHPLYRAYPATYRLLKTECEEIIAKGGIFAGFDY